MARTHILGFPRIGARRELKFAQEAFWRGETPEAALRETGATLRRRHWQLQADAGLATVAAGDFAWYDQMLGLTALLGALPKRFGFDAASLTLAQYYELARGNAAQPAMEMTKWFDTNYHYLVPELDADSTFGGGPTWFLDEVDEALALGLATRPVLIGPVTYLYLSKSHVPGFDRLTLLPKVVQAYRRILAQLRERGIEWVQIDEPVLCLDIDAEWLDAIDRAYVDLADLAEAGPKVLLATYFDTAAPHAARAAALPVHGFHVDLVRAPEQLETWLQVLPANAVLSAGVIDGRNIWRADLRAVLATLAPLHAQLGDRLWIAPSCSLLHVPVSLDAEQRLDPELKSWLAFATEKLEELRTLAVALNQGKAAAATQLAASDAARESRRTSRRVVNQRVQGRLAAVTADMADRASAFDIRIERQREALQLPALPTTTIGSFPQTTAIRQTRAAYKRGEIGALDYLQRIRGEIELAVRKQEALGIDVLVHGEAERNDMVEYFGEQLCGYAFTENGWVQSYGSRCVKPPVIYGDVYRPEPMTVDTARYAQSLTDKPMKGMLTGPVTMLQWSFVRDDQPRATTARQLALAIRDEVRDLEAAGIRIIQIDEPALREGLPLRRDDWTAYLEWAVNAFRLSAAGVSDQTQIHTHMCYAEFNDILPAIAAMDADVITIETSRSAMELLEGFGEFDYPNEIGPGVYDIHSPRVPTVEAITRLLERACEVIPPERLWVNPDCGLKTRGWPETEAALANMITATRQLRGKLASQPPVTWKRVTQPAPGSARSAATAHAHGTACDPNCAGQLSI
ncbi:5-methyltetrahydropteroyltriglutamate--homocysteine methyltransferase [Cupriavidus metallidurans]|jgi:5-methyltetrahydropteroyltriglutamate--homocysteine methyltransferase|uniref:5-methyltetrahydropteroyltriglutamate-- homocysteine S-methyltransferase n=1 Tax=Cupriavidus TaxID=106589 RepID=UPI0004933AA5|nr:5-methyltetrahydropteroyltriglutamate--homocysteine S-methyltransferase [Cupriavidus metallidurans]MDE4920367.1 5-methyltetrahydropteroyltriglutamate--homocysteine S-methyltransferase [Cupriavidus metallidurans]